MRHSPGLMSLAENSPFFLVVAKKPLLEVTKTTPTLAFSIACGVVRHHCRRLPGCRATRATLSFIESPARMPDLCRPERTPAPTRTE